MKVSLVVLILSFTLCAEQAKQQPKQRQAPWQTSWDAFVQEYKKCEITPDLSKETEAAFRDRLQACDRDFIGKDVVWEGLVKSINLKGEATAISMDMGTLPLKLDNLGFYLNPTADQRAKWNEIKVGQRVRFRTRVDGGLHDSVITASSVGGRIVIAIFNTKGAELVSVLKDN